MTSSPDNSQGCPSPECIEPQQDVLDSVDDELSSSTDTDATWTPSIDGKDSDEDLDLDDNPGIWEEVPSKYDDFSITFNKVDSDLECGYKEEVKQLENSWQYKDDDKLRRLSNDQFKQICKSYNCTYSNKKKDKLVQ